MHSMKRPVLDIDPSIIERNLLTIQNDDTVLDSLFPKEEDKTPTKLIKPLPGFCVKGHTLESDEDKLFINVCQTDDIPPPEDILEQKLIEILATEEASEYRIPMSIGQARPVQDKSGNPATAYDIAINTAFFQKMQYNELFKRFFLNVAFEGLEEKYKISINMENFCILKNRKAMGNLQLHCIQDREVMRKMKKEKKIIEVLDVPESNKRYPPYKIVQDKIDGVDCVIADLFMPDVGSFKNINVQVNDERLVVDTIKPNYFLDIFFPVKVDWKKSTSHYDSTSGFLTVTMPVILSE